MSDYLPSKDLQLTDLFRWYPPQDDPNLPSVLAGYEEFTQVAGTVDEPLPKSGSFFSHQKQIYRFMMVYDVCGLFHDAGTGKSCSAFWPADQLLHDPNSGIKKVVVLVRNPLLKEELKNELVENCTRGRYLTPRVQEARTEQGRKTIINRVLDEAGYEFYTFGRFASMIDGMTDKEIREIFSQTFFILDELQFLRPDMTVKPKKRSDETGKKTNEEIYRAIERVFLLTLWIKVLGLTATPMINSVQEIGPVYNLLLVAARREPFPPNTNFNDISLEELADRMGGLVSVIRSLDVGVDLITMAKPPTAKPDESNVANTVIVEGVGDVYAEARLFMSTMGEPQEEAMYQASQRRSTVYTEERQVANFVFPDGSWGSQGFNKYVESYSRAVGGKGGKGYRFRQGRPQDDREDNFPSVKEVVSNMELLRDYSAKFASVVQIEKDQLKKERPGKAWIYSDFVGVGTILLGLVLEAHGFQQYDGTVPAVRRTIQGFVPNREKTPRYALISQGQSPVQVENIKRLYNSAANIDGEYLQILIGSPVARTGLNLFDVVRIVPLGPPWNLNTDVQSKARALRSVGHRRLLQRERRETGDPDAKVQVLIYPHAVVNEDLPSFSDLQNIEVRIYLRAQAKQVPIHRQEMMYSAIAWDCLLNRERNLNGVDPTGLPIEYNCYYPEPTRFSNRNYIAEYSGTEIANVIDKFKWIFQQEFSFEYFNIFNPDLLPMNPGEAPHSPVIIQMALQQLMASREPILDRFGLKSFVQQEGEQVFLQRTFPGEVGQYNLLYYDRRLIARVPFSLEKAQKIFEDPGLGEQVQRLKEINTTTQRGFDLFQARLMELDLSTRTQMLEESLAQTLNMSLSDSPNNQDLPEMPVFDADLQEALATFIYEFRDPEPILSQLERIRAEPRRGRPAKEGNLASRQQEFLTMIEEPTTGNLVLVHTLLALPPSNVGYSAINRKLTLPGTIRVMDITKRSGRQEASYWRNANPLEANVYRELIGRRIRKITEPMEKYGIYGIRDVLTGEFLIRDRYGEDLDAEMDARKKRSGRNCSNWDTQALINTMYRLGIPEFESDGPQNLSVEEQKNYLLGEGFLSSVNMAPEEVVYTYKWFRSRQDNSRFCQQIQNFLIDNDRVVDL